MPAGKLQGGTRDARHPHPLVAAQVPLALSLSRWQGPAHTLSPKTHTTLAGVTLALSHTLSHTLFRSTASVIPAIVVWVLGPRVSDTVD